MGSWHKMVTPGRGNSQSKMGEAWVLPGDHPSEELEVRVYRCRKEIEGPVHQTLLLTT